MRKTIQLLKKDLIVDWRQQHPFSGILLYLGAVIFPSYIAFKGLISLRTWNVLFWIILLFISIQAISKSFFQEDKRSHYYFFLTEPSLIILGKLIYSFVYLLVIAFLALIIYSVLLGNPTYDIGFFLLNMVLGIAGLSSGFTMVSAIAFKAGSRSIMMTILGFPIIVPVLVLAMNNSEKILAGNIRMQIQGNLLALLSVDVIIIALAFVLFPFIWRS